MTNNELNFAGLLDLSRFMTALRYLGSVLTADEVWFLADQSKCGQVDIDEENKIKQISF